MNLHDSLVTEDDFRAVVRILADLMKQILLHFGVHSRPQLIARFRDGDGKDHA